MNPSRVAAVVLRQFYLLRGSLARLMPLVSWVAIDMVLWGFMTRYLDEITAARLGFAATLLGCVLLWDVFIRVMHGVAIAFFEDLWSRNFLNMFSSPLTIPEYLAGLVLTAVGTSLLGLAAMLLLASGVFGLDFLAYGAALIPYLLVLFLFGVALGILSVAMVLRLGPAAEWLVWPVPAFISPFAGVLYPVATLPPWMRAVARLVPPSYVFEGIRSGAPGSLAPALALSAAYTAAAGFVFAATYRACVRDGRLARYGAESAG